MVNPHVSYFEIVVLSTEQLLALAIEHGLHVQSCTESDDSLIPLMKELHQKWKCRRLVVCRKARDAGGTQERWSLLIERTSSGTKAISTHASMVRHFPIDECGGGSAWMAGFLHGLVFQDIGSQRSMQRADLLAALCQETKGDFSTVTASQLKEAEHKFGGGVADLTKTPLVHAPCEAQRQIEQTLAKLKCAGVVAILRAKGDATVAIRRGLELAELGCRAMEVTLDSCDWQKILGDLRRSLPDKVLLGIGTVMDDSVCHIERAALLGADFALSPIDPDGFVHECHSRGVLAVPSALTSNECWQLHRRGVRLIKLFHAGMVNPAILKSILDVTPLGKNLNILPSGGVSPQIACHWWDAGAPVVGMGSNLVGKDLCTIPGTSAHAIAVKEWLETGRPLASELFQAVGERFPHPDTDKQ